MRILILTQADRFFIPGNVALLCSEPRFEILEIVAINRKSSLENMKGRFLRWFGPVAVARLAARHGLARLTGIRGKGKTPGTLRDVARRHDIPYSVVSDVNDRAFVERVRSLRPDVIVSYSAPQVFKPELLGTAAMGCLNLHCSLLPAYRGLLPSFWVLLNGEPATGATVHRMDENIDTGEIVRQEQVDIRGVNTMYEVMRRTKAVGGRLMLEALRSWRDDGATAEQAGAAHETGPSLGWPTDEDARAFRAKGMRLA